MPWDQNTWENLTEQNWSDYDLFQWGELYIPEFNRKLGAVAQATREFRSEEIVFSDYHARALLEEIDRLRSKMESLRYQNKMVEAEFTRRELVVLENEFSAYKHHLIYD